MTRTSPRRPTTPPLTKWQRRCLRDLRAQARAQPDLLTVGHQEPDDEGNLLVQFSLNTQDLPTPASDGVKFKPVEEFVLRVEQTDERPPIVLLPHPRFIGTPHVLSGFYLCLYLDEAREWDPLIGINGKNGVLDRLWDWMGKAARNDFNPNDALYHAVGGVPHVDSGAPAIVVRDLPEPTRRITTLRLHQRTPKRFDLVPAGSTAGPDDAHVPVFWADSDLPLGAGHHLGSLLLRLRNPRPFGLVAYMKRLQTLQRVYNPPRWVQAVYASRNYACTDLPNLYTPEPEPAPFATTPDAALFTALVASASRNPEGSVQHLILAVPHPVGGPHHLLALRLSPTLADYLRTQVEHKTTPLIAYEPDTVPVTAPIGWDFVSDERPAVTTRRDTNRPVAALHNQTVVVLGCGGLGSWISEFVVRAGASRVILSDQGRVTGGLLVRQNYVEDDNGTHKAIALQSRLQAISDTTIIEAYGRLSTGELAHLATHTDLIIDATISLRVTQQLDTVVAKPNRTATVAQVATDARTGTLGHAIISPPGDPTTMTSMDQTLKQQVHADGALERYRYFWEEPGPEDEFIPTRGCSAPTFHGSAADMAAVAGGLTTLIAKHMTTPARGSHLMALPHADINPSHKYLPYTT